MLSNSKALSNSRFLLVVQTSIFYLVDKAKYTGNSLVGDIRIGLDRVVMKLADKLVSREAFAHHDVNLLLGGNIVVMR